MKNESDAQMLHMACYSRADELYKAGNLRQAIKEFRAGLVLAPNDADTLWAIADCLSELGQVYKAERMYRAALARADWSQRGGLLYNIANALLDQRRPIAALALYRQVARKSGAYHLAQKNARLARRILKNDSLPSTAVGQRRKPSRRQ